MARYRCVAHVTISVSTLVDADSEEQALEIAAERELQGLPANDSGYPEDEYWCHGGELDGSPENIHIEK